MVASAMSNSLAEPFKGAQPQGLANTERALQDLTFNRKSDNAPPETAPYSHQTSVVQEAPVRFYGDDATASARSPGNAPTVTAIITIHNAAETIETALLSVIRQTRQADEIIVVDTCSTDDGPERVRALAKDHPISLVIQTEGDELGARNFGIRHARGDLIALLDQASQWRPTHLATLLQPFQGTSLRPLGWSYGNFDEADSNGRILVRSVLQPADHPKATVTDCLRRDMLLPLSASLIDRRALESIGGFDEALGDYAGDDCFTRLLHAGYDSVFIDLPLTQRHQPANNHRSPVSRDLYARKLIEAHPGDRTLIASRFAADYCIQLREALAVFDDAEADRCLTELNLLDRYLERGPSPGRNRRDLIVSVVIPLYDRYNSLKRRCGASMPRRGKPKRSSLSTMVQRTTAPPSFAVWRLKSPSA